MRFASGGRRIRINLLFSGIVLTAALCLSGALPAGAAEQCAFDKNGDYVCKKTGTGSVGGGEDMSTLEQEAARQEKSDSKGTAPVYVPSRPGCEKVTVETQVPVLDQNGKPVLDENGNIKMKKETTQTEKCPQQENETSIEDKNKEIARLEDQIRQLDELLNTQRQELQYMMQDMSPQQQMQFARMLEGMLNGGGMGGGGMGGMMGGGMGGMMGGGMGGMMGGGGMGGMMGGGMGGGGMGGMMGGMGGSGSPLANMVNNLAGQVGSDTSRGGNWSTNNGGQASYKDLGGLTKGPSCNPSEHKPMTEQQPSDAAFEALKRTDGAKASSCTDAAQKGSKGSAAGGAANGASSCAGGDVESGTTTGAVVKLLATREGWKNKAYWDVKGYSIGIGHFGASAGQVISNEQVLDLFKQDVKKYWDAAQKQMKELGIDDHCFFTHLVSVNFQLGTGWTSKFPGAWNQMKQGNFSGAIQNVSGSKWARQTPVRVQDFTSSLKGMIGQSMQGGKKITLFIRDRIMDGIEAVKYAWAGPAGFGDDGGVPWCAGPSGYESGCA